MKTGISYIRVIIFMVVAFWLLEFIIDSGEQMAIVKYPIIWAVLGVLLLFAIAVEVIVEAMNSILYRGLDEEAKKRFKEQEALKKEQGFGWFSSTYKKLLGSKPVEKEAEIIFDHNYDGIKELDNTLPPWWVYMFYATIVFAVVYLVRYEVFDDVNQTEEYEIAVAKAKLEIEAYKKTAKDLVDVNTVELLTDASDLSAGKTIYEMNCVACHKADGGGGIGPNLTDTNWILGGGIKNVFNTISEGGRAGKGMVPWKNDLKPLEMAQVASYLLTFQGTTPAEPKEAEGDVWIDPDAPQIEASTEVTPDVSDSTEVNN
ncbi:MAG: c-type cytochrome [Altibacter sp.]|uniref:cbb3-type cytochrome c oxidase N-terminal domain-containing protein n=1 Tax=Altibacter sp. TaxID=2024823 RepID=UPI001D29F906|nr:cbb3-type cytochrome c oxidase N-terminal domain-containing protein [Altibacter sp.]MBZ0328038.1 c-type cytochrome [Altibacter sp.]